MENCLILIISQSTFIQLSLSWSPLDSEVARSPEGELHLFLGGGRLEAVQDVRASLNNVVETFPSKAGSLTITTDAVPYGR